MNKPKLEKAVFDFTQDGNCIESAGEIEELSITFESSLGIDEDEDGFFVLRTNGWSIDNAEELDELLKRVKSIVKKKPRK